MVGEETKRETHFYSERDGRVTLEGLRMSGALVLASRTMEQERREQEKPSDGAFSLFHAHTWYTTLHPDPRPKSQNQP